jgi:hypothetical protein
MPAIRHFHQCVFVVNDHMPSQCPVEVRQRDGTFVRLHWLGMLCEPATEILPGLGFVKIKAHEITEGDGIAKCSWYRLQEGEYVLGWRCHRGDSASQGQGVYGVVDKNGCPIVVGKQGRKGAPTLRVVGG